jgi:hypothetical protein
MPEKPLSEFDFSNNAGKRVATCKNCVGKKDENNEPYGACCQYHFEEMVVTNTYNQLEAWRKCSGCTKVGSDVALIAVIMIGNPRPVSRHPANVIGPI